MKILGTIEGTKRNIIIYRFYDVFIVKHPKGRRREAIKFFEEKLLDGEVKGPPKYDVVILGRPYRVVERGGSPNYFLKDDTIIVFGREKSDRLKMLENVIKWMLLKEIRKTFDEFSQRGFKVPKKIKVKKSFKILASIRKDRMIISLFSAAIPRNSLRCLLSHEVAHLYHMNHGEKFFKTMLKIFPEALDVENPIDSFKKYFSMSVAFWEIATSGRLWIYVQYPSKKPIPFLNERSAFSLG